MPRTLEDSPPSTGDRGRKRRDLKEQQQILEKRIDACWDEVVSLVAEYPWKDIAQIATMAISDMPALEARLHDLELKHALVGEAFPAAP